MRGVRARIVRQIVRDRAFVLPAGGVLVLAAASAAALVGVLHAVLLRPLPFPDAHRLVTLCERHATLEGYCVVSPPNLVDLAGDPALAVAGLARDWSFQVSVDGRRLRVPTGLASEGVFRALGASASPGRLPGAAEVGEDAGRVVLISNGLWHSAFRGSADVVGQTVSLDGLPHTVVGVLPPGFAVPGLEDVVLWRPPLMPLDRADLRSWRGFRAFARLADGATLDGARGALQARYGRLMEAHVEVTPEWRLAVVPLLDSVVGDVRGGLLMLAGAVVLLVVIAAGNTIALQMVRHLRRGHQHAIRAVLGASPTAAAGEELAHAAALGVAAGLTAMAPAWLLLVGLRRVAPPGLPRVDEIAFTPLTAATCLGVALILPLVGWATIAVRAPRDTAMGERLRQTEGAGEGPARTRLRTGLVTVELALSLVLLAGAVALARSFAAYRSWDPGFDPRGVVTAFAGVSPTDVPSPEEVVRVWMAVEAALMAVPGVHTAATVSAGPLFGGRETAEAWRSDAPSTGVALRWYDMGPGYFEALSMSIVRGRNISEADRMGTPPVAVINETLARRLWGDGEALGGRITLDDVSQEPLTVVGVVHDRAPLTPGVPTDPELWWSNRQMPRWGAAVVVRVEPGASTTLREIQAALDRAHPALDAGAFTPLASRLERALVTPRFHMLLAGTFAALAALLAVAGLYGLVSFAVTRRRRELGVRLALGATRRQLVAQVVAWAALPVGVGVLLGLPVGLITGSLMERTVPGIGGDSIVALAGAAVVLAVTALLAALQPAIRAGRSADPVALMRD